MSSFGISGTNAHVIVEQAPAAPEEVTGTGNRQMPAVGTGRPAARLAVVPWVVSAKTAGALADQAARLLDHLRGHPQLEVVDVGWSLSGRSMFEHRAVVVGADRDQLLARSGGAGRR